MSTTTPKQYGLTPPISVTAPLEAELKANDALTEELKRENNFESSDETERRKSTLATLQRITQEFVRHVCKKKGLSAAAIEAAGGKIFTFGSYRLGVYNPGSDIDTLMVVPKYVERADFFGQFPEILRKMVPEGTIEGLAPVPEAFVPIIKMKFNNISIDLIFAKLALASIPLTLDLKDNNLLRGLDEADTRSLNGTRVTDEILELVPQSKTFRLALRGVKMWAKRRAIYANVMGFPGGVAWAMLVARVCQLYPRAVGSVILGKFFRIMARWDWPQPVLLKAIEDGPIPNARVWNPKIRRGDRFHLMPIITPAYPSMCSTHNVTHSSKKILLRELNRGGDICDKIMTGQLKWSDLFARHTFFTKDYKYYISIVASAMTKDSQLVWSGLVESRVRQLIMKLEENPVIEIARPFNEGFQRVHKCPSQEAVQAVRQGSMEFLVQTETTDESKDATHAAAVQNAAEDVALPTVNGVSENAEGEGNETYTTVYTATYYVGVELRPNAGKSLDISNQTFEFKKMCYGWDKHDQASQCLHVAHVRDFNLPDDVFKPGDVRPVPPIKKTKVVKKVEGGVKKRSIDELEDTTAPTIKRRISANGVVTPVATPS